MKMLSMVQPF